ncbi:hypothetical protein [Sphingosinithalassobacter portus]|uniref:hypothetical protein n=1 Tax=Stakelama portus TaxID=2676234 RepID=UPI0011AB3133|nr:hypothetical protein [Sphingosinithalassobacter portus]
MPEVTAEAKPEVPAPRFFAVHGLLRDAQGNEGGFFYPFLAAGENGALAMGYQSIERDFPGVRVAHIWANDLTEISAQAIAEIDQHRLRITTD